MEEKFNLRSQIKSIETKIKANDNYDIYFEINIRSI